MSNVRSTGKQKTLTTFTLLLLGFRNCLGMPVASSRTGITFTLRGNVRERNVSKQHVMNLYVSYCALLWQSETYALWNDLR